MKKRIITIALAMSMLITNIYTSTEAVYASDLAEEVAQAQLEESSMEQSETEENVNTPSEIEDSVTEESAQNPSEESITEDAAEVPAEESITEDMAQPPTEESSTEDMVQPPTEGETLTSMLNGANTAPAAHSLSKVYWNPNKENTLSGTGSILQYAGNDSNSGSTARYPVLTAETALERASAEAEIICMNYEGCTSDTTLDAGFYPVTIKREDGYTGNIFQITGGILELDNLTLDGSDSYEDRVLTIGGGGTLKIGDSVGNVGDSFYFVEATANPVVLAGEPESGTKYTVQFADGFFEKGCVTVQETQTKEVLLVDATESGMEPETYFSIKNLPSGWSVYQKGNQLWAKTTIMPVPESPYTEIWIDGVNGNDSNSGRNQNSCVKTWARAYQLYQDKLQGNGTIYVNGTITVSEGELTVNTATLKRAKGFGNPIFQVTSSGSLTIQSGVILSEAQGEDDDATYYAIESEGAVKVAKSAAVAEVILLENRSYPLELTGTGDKTFRIEAGGNYEDGDLIVKNGVEPVVSLELGNFCLKAVETDSYLYVPPVIFINGAAGDDTQDGLTTKTAVRTLERATQLALIYGTGTLVVFGGPITVSDGSSKVLESYLLIQNLTNYTGDIFEVTNGTLTLAGKVFGNTTANDTGKIVVSGGSIKGNITMAGQSSLQIEGGSIKGTVAVQSNASAVQTAGKVQGNVTLTGGSFALKAGKIKGDILQNSGSPSVEISGGTVEGKVDIASGSTLMQGGVIKKNGVVISGSGTFTLSGGEVTECGTAVKVSEGSFAMTGGSIGEDNSKGLVIEENGSATLSGGTIQESSLAAVEAAGDLYLKGTPVIAGEICLKNTAHPIQLSGAIPAEYKYTLEFAGDYIEGAGTNDAVVGTVAAPATLAQFSLSEDTSLLLELTQDGNNLVLTKCADPEGIYWNGEDVNGGNDSYSGESPSQAVKSWERVKELLLEKYDNGNGKELDVYVCGRITVPSEGMTLEVDRETFPWNPKIIRYLGYKGVMLWAYYGSLTLQNVTLDGNGKTESTSAMISVGGNIGSTGRTLTIKDGTVIENSRGAAIYCGYGTVNMEGGIVRNIVGTQGNQTYVLYFNSGTFYMSGGRIEKSEAYTAICYLSNSDMVISGGTIQDNITQNGGTIAFSWSGNYKITGGTFQNNTAQTGGVFELNGYNQLNLKIEGGNFLKNHAEMGGVIYLFGGGLEVAGGVFEENSASYGGAMYLTPTRFNSSPHLTTLTSDFTMRDNTASIKGDGIYTQQSDSDMNPEDFECMAFGRIQNEQTIYLGSYRNIKRIFPIGLSAAIADPSSRIELEVDPELASLGTPVVVPDGENVTNAAQYIRNFTIAPESGYVLVPSGRNIVLGQAYYVDGVNGDDNNAGNRPSTAFKTMEKAIAELGSQAGSIYVCGTVTIPAGTTADWTLNSSQSIVRYSGVGRDEKDDFTGQMIVVEENAVLNLTGVKIYGALSEDDAEKNEYLLVQKGTLSMDGDSSCSNGILYLADQKVIDVSGISSALLATVEKENAKEGDVIGKYDTADGGNAANFRLSSKMLGFGLIADADEVRLAESGCVYVDGVNGDDSRDGLTAETAVKTLQTAYTRIQGKGGTIYVVDTVAVTSDTTLSPWLYSCGADRIATTGAVQIVRYEKNKNSLLKVQNNTLTLSKITIDGAKETAAEHASALIEVGAAGSLKLTEGAVLKNNKNTENGGAVYNEGTVEIGNCHALGNEAKKGAFVYHEGSSLTLTDAKANLTDNEIFLAAGKYINVSARLSDGVSYAVNLDSADATEGRVIAVFTPIAYDPKGVIEEADHFAVSKEATNRVLEASGEDTLVLAGDFEVTLNGTEFFVEAESEIVLNAVFQNAKSAQVEVSVTKEGEEIAYTVKEYNRYKQIRIPAEEKNVGTLNVVFSYRGAQVEKEVVLSTYAVVYQDGASSLVAKPQEIGASGVHKDNAWIHICNGAKEVRTFAVGDILVAYEDGSEVECRNEKVSADMEDAMRYLGIEIAETTEIAAASDAYVPIELFNGNSISEEKSGTITLADITYGSNWAATNLSFVTRPVSRVRVRLNLDDELDNTAEVAVENIQTGERITLEFDAGASKETQEGLLRTVRRLLAGQEVWQYGKENLKEGSYRILVDGEDTGETFDLTKSAEVTRQIDRYHISYETNGGTFAETVPQVYIKGMGLSNLPTPEKENAEFAGWFTTKDLSGEPVTEISSTEGKRLTLYAGWKEAKDSLTISLAQKSYLEKDGGTATIYAAVGGAAAKDVAVKATTEEGQDITAELITGESGNYKTVVIPVHKENVGTYCLNFLYKGENLEEKVTISAYEVCYVEGQDALLAQAQQDGSDEIHKDYAWLTVYNGYDAAKQFSVGKVKMSYENSLDSVQIANYLVDKNMESANTMKYFGLEWDARSKELSAKGQETFALTFSNGDKLTDSRRGTLLLKECYLGEDEADIAVAFQTKAITRLQVAGTWDDEARDDLSITLQKTDGTVCSLVNLIGEHPTAKQWYQAATGEISLRYNYQITGLSEGTYELFVNGKDCGRKVTIVPGTVEKESVSLYSVTYELNGGTMQNQPEQYYIAGVGLKLPVPLREGYEFSGWYLSKELEGETLDAIGKERTKLVRVYAKWNTPVPVYSVSTEPHQSAPATFDAEYLIYDVALVGGIAILMRMFYDNFDDGMAEEEKERLIRNIIRKTKGKGLFFRICALAKIFVILLFYYTLGAKVRRQEEREDALTNE